MVLVISDSFVSLPGSPLGGSGLADLYFKVCATGIGEVGREAKRGENA